MTGAETGTSRGPAPGDSGVAGAVTADTSAGGPAPARVAGGSAVGGAAGGPAPARGAGGSAPAGVAGWPADPAAVAGGVTGRVVELPTAADTRELGRLLAEVVRAGDLVVLAGPLGAGKTVLVQGIGAGLGVAGAVTSPTFVIARVHRGGRLPLVHADAYRLGSVAEVDDLDLDASLEESVTVVEWGAGLVEELAEARLEVRINRDIEGERRTAELVPYGADWAERLRCLAVPTSPS